MDVTAATLDIAPCPACGRRNPTDAAFCGGCGHGLEGVGQPKENIADPLVGRIIADRYRIRALLGRGGMGVVYKVEHVHIGKLMAMKLLHGELARDRNTTKRFQREAEAVSQLNHPNTVQIFDFGRSEGLMYLVMEYLEGHDLGEVIRAKEHLEFSRVARIAAQVCASVSEAHSLGIVHRDLKPENVMIVPNGDSETAKVLDFGLAKLRDHTGNVSVTRAGAIVGTPYYMSPEQIRGEEVDARGDIYAIGAMIYKACTGVPPFAAKTPMGVLTKHLTEPLVPPSERSSVYLPPEVDAIITRTMQKDPAQRHQSADELRGELLAYLESVGQHYSDPGLRRPTPSQQARAPVVATRKEVERYERRLRRRGIFGYIFLALLIAGLVGGAGYAWNRLATEPSVASEESEPNDLPESANRLPAATGVTGTLGRRQSPEVGDIDLYEIESPVERGLLDVSVTGLPNIDMVVDLYRPGRASPLLSANMGGVGEDEVIVGFPIRDAKLLIRVRERWIQGQLPTENVSDSYRIEWSVTDAEDPEGEVNDSLERAASLPLGGSVVARLGWGGDTDTFCVTGEGEGVVVEVGGLEGVDLVMRTVDRVLRTSRKIDEAGIGEAERATLDGPVDRVCVEVGANESTPGGHLANAEETYTVTATRPSASP